MHRRAALALPVTLLAGLALAPGASAGTYKVHNCQLPSGAPTTADGWRFSFLSQSSGNSTCRPVDGRPTVLSAWMLRSAAHNKNDGIEITWSAPPNTEIQDYTVWRNVNVKITPPGSYYNFYYQGMQGIRDNDHIVDLCGGLNGGCGGLPPILERRGLTGVRDLWLNVRCYAPEGQTCPVTSPDEAGILNISRAEFTLRDDSLPEFTSPPSGTLLDSSRPLTGTEYVSLAVSDSGSGVDQALFEVDGTVVASETIDDNEGRCRAPFTSIVPCRLRTAKTLGFDTSRLPDGEHRLRILVADATGTNVAPFGPVRIRTVNTVNAPIDTGDPPCLLPPTDGADLRLTAALARGRPTATVKYGRQATIAGRLTNGRGEPLAGATVCVAHQDERSGAPLVTQASVVTGADGGFTYVAPRGPSRRVHFAHRADGGAVAVSSVRLRVPAAVKLQASRRSLRNGQRVVLSGGLRGRPFPAEGTLVELQARRSSGWQTFGTAEANARGRFRFTYQFTRTEGTQRYRLRARVPRQSAYPYATGASRPVRVRVSG